MNRREMLRESLRGLTRALPKALGAAMGLKDLLADRDRPADHRGTACFPTGKRGVKAGQDWENKYKKEVKECK